MGGHDHDHDGFPVLQPRRPKGASLFIFLSFYAFSIFGFFTANFASYLVGGARKGGAERIPRPVNRPP